MRPRYETPPAEAPDAWPRREPPEPADPGDYPRAPEGDEVQGDRESAPEAQP